MKNTCFSGDADTENIDEADDDGEGKKYKFKRAEFNDNDKVNNYNNTTWHHFATNNDTSENIGYIIGGEKENFVADFAKYTGNNKCGTTDEVQTTNTNDNTTNNTTTNNTPTIIINDMFAVQDIRTETAGYFQNNNNDFFP